MEPFLDVAVIVASITVLTSIGAGIVICMLAEDKSRSEEQTLKRTKK